MVTVLKSLDPITAAMPAKRAAIYPRVSDPYGEKKREKYAGGEQETSLDTQEAAMRRYAAERGYVLDNAHVYRETHTGVELWERPKLTALREAIRRREVDVVIVHAIDRLSRDPVHLGVILTEAEHAGVDIQFVTEPLDNSPEGALIRFVRGYAAKIEHEKIKERTIRGKRARTAAGKLLPGCRPRYGFRFSDGKTRFEIDPATAPIVRRMFHLAERGTSIRQIAVTLTSDRIPTPAGAAAWSHATVRTILHDPIYAGHAAAWRYVMEKNTRGGTTVRLRDASEHVPLPDGTAPALVSQATFDAVQARLRLNQLRAARNNHAPYLTLLRGGYVRCGICGYAMHATMQPRGSKRTPALIYACPRHAQVDGQRCCFNIRASVLDDAVWSRVERVLGQRGVIAAELERMRTSDPTADDLVAVEHQLTAVARQQRNLIENLAHVSGTAAALIAEKLNTLEAQRAQLAGERQGVLQRRTAWEAAQGRLDELEAWCSTVATNLETLTYDEKRLALDALNVQVKLWPASHTPRYEIFASLPLDEAAAASTAALPDQTPDKYCEKKLKTFFQPSTACSGR